jgi:hypothetical protein
MLLLKVYRRHLDGYPDSLHPRLSVGALDLPYAVSSSSHPVAAAVVPGVAAVALAEEHSLVEAQQFVNIIMQQQHMSQSAVASESMRGVEKEQEEEEEEGAVKGSMRGSAAPYRSSSRSISIASLQPKFQLLRSPPTELKQHFDL